MSFNRSIRARCASVGFAVLSTVVSILIGRFAVASHVPFSQNLQGFKLLTKRTNGGHHSWQAVHVLAAGCRCSRGVADHLARRGRIAGLHETAVLIGNDNRIEESLRKVSFPIIHITSAEASNLYGLEGAPSFTLLDLDNAIRYTGGYTRARSQRDEYLDTEIWQNISAGTTYPALPIFGCAIGLRAKRAIDPLGLETFTSGYSR